MDIWEALMTVVALYISCALGFHFGREYEQLKKFEATPPPESK